MTSASIALQQDAIAECYEDIRMLIYKVTHRIAARYNVPFEELIGEAHLSFVRAWHNYHPERFRKKAQFSSFVYFALNCDLTTHLQKRAKHVLGHVEINEEICGTEDHNSFRMRFETELEQDARTVLHLLLDSPQEVNVRMHAAHVRSKRKTMRVLRQYLQEEMGWSRTQVNVAFEDIRVALTRY